MSVEITERPAPKETGLRHSYDRLWDATLDGARFATIVQGGEHGYEVIWADRSRYYSTATLEDAERRIRERAAEAR